MGERIIDERKFKREDSLNIVDYSVLGEDGEPEDQGMGLTLNVGEAGILLETHIPLNKGNILLVHIGFEHETVELKGKVTYTAVTEDNKHRTGIEFMDVKYEDKFVLRKFLKALVYKSKYSEEKKEESKAKEEIPHKTEKKKKHKDKHKKKIK